MSAARSAAELAVLEFYDPSAVAAQATAGLGVAAAGPTTTRQRGGSGNVQWAAAKHPRGFHGRFTVAQGQQQLQQSGHYQGKVDGQHGPKTVAALKAWQKQQGLAVTGRFDAGTVATMQAPPPMSRAEAVKQEKAAELAAKPKTAKGSTSKTTTGKTTAKSKAAGGSGRRSSAGPSASNQRTGGRAAGGSGWRGNLSPVGVLRPGVGQETRTNGKPKRVRGDGEVRLLQAKLLALGFDLGDGGIDGRFGKATEEAVKRFQREHGLDVTGVVDRHTKRLLNLMGQQERVKAKTGTGLSIDQMGLSEAARVAQSAAVCVLEAKAKPQPATAEERKALWARFPQHAPKGDTGGAYSLKRDSGGLFIHTHRARSKSYPTVAAIPKSVAEFIESSG